MTARFAPYLVTVRRQRSLVHRGAGGRSKPPAANGWTERDGSFSADAEAGRALYDAQCASCHALPLTTSRQVLPTGITEGVSGTPALVGIYRHQTWLKRGEARTLEAAVAEAMRYVGGDASEAKVAALTRFVSELTGRECRLGGSRFGPG